MAHSSTYRRVLTKLGYYDYQQGLIIRHMKVCSGWETHLANCRRFIIDTVKKEKPNKITVLGSGWLLDFPLVECLSHVALIDLVDIVHPPQVKEQIKPFPGVTTVDADVSGGLIEEVWKKSATRFWLFKRKSLETLTVPRFELIEPGLVISLNILTQLEVLPIRFLEKRSNYTETDYLRFRKEVQNSHLEMLKNHNSLLITDIKEIFNHNDGSISEEVTMVADLPEGSQREEWRWDFDSVGMDFNHKRSVMEVVAVKL